MREEVFNILAQAIAPEYANSIADSICDDVYVDLKASAGMNYNYTDLRLSIGRVICKKLNCEL